MIRACIIGVSGFGETHYNDLVREYLAGRAEIIAATIINQDEEKGKCAFLKSLGTELYTDYNAMLRRHGGNTDVCFIPTGIPQHAPMTITALEAGANVFVEKPAAAVIQDVFAMRMTEEKLNKFVAVGYQSIYASETTLMKEALLNGRIGTVRTIACQGLWPRPDSYYRRNSWAGRLRSNKGEWVLDSPFNNALAHQLNMILFLAGAGLQYSANPVSVQAELYRARAGIDSADTAGIRIQTQEGPTLLFLGTHCSSATIDPIIEARGDNGVLQWKINQGAEITTQSGHSETIAVDNWQQCRTRIFEALAHKCADPNSFVCDLNIAGKQTLVVNAAHDSSPVKKLPESKTYRVQRGTDDFSVIIDIDRIMDICFRQGKMPSETDASWAETAPIYPIQNYSCFKGLYC